LVARVGFELDRDLKRTVALFLLSSPCSRGNFKYDYDVRIGTIIGDKSPLEARDKKGKGE